VLANILRTDMHAHRPLPADTELAQAIAVLARAQQDAVWARTQAHNKLRSHLREYYPGFLAAFADSRDGIMRPGARGILAAAPTPAAAALTLAQLRALLRKSGRSRGLDAEAARLRTAFRAVQMRQLPLVEEAMGRQALALLGHLDAACASASDLEQAVIERPAPPGPPPDRVHAHIEPVHRCPPVLRTPGPALTITRGSGAAQLSCPSSPSCLSNDGLDRGAAGQVYLKAAQWPRARKPGDADDRRTGGMRLPSSQIRCWSR
jgi:hypothetical protein